jgi:hypothetical protein
MYLASISGYIYFPLLVVLITPAQEVLCFEIVFSCISSFPFSQYDLMVNDTDCIPLSCSGGLFQSKTELLLLPLKPRRSATYPAGC